MSQSHPILPAEQLAALETAFRQGSANASEALVRWIGKPSVVETVSLDVMPLEDATGLLGDEEQPICFCAAAIRGAVDGEMILAFDDQSGLSLAEMLIDNVGPDAQMTSPSPQDGWDELSESAVVETTNILCCAYLNALSAALAAAGGPSDLTPSPPNFSREFPGSLLEFALMGQAVANDYVLLSRTRFEIANMPVHWTLLLVPDSAAMERLADLVPSEK